MNGQINDIYTKLLDIIIRYCPNYNDILAARLLAVGLKWIIPFQIKQKVWLSIHARFDVNSCSEGSWRHVSYM